ncbi:GTPase-activating protein GYP1 isoform X2 [Diospyros lotus]|uniref:GTPase-activating protein GYP1 isoform X2 n=1 Tax=Diospyros lotus TaxID=55363 RepID=UPI00225BBC4C|nr:GTPase-activating protein GYP1 isoform X2 [Diospyros lotus]
MNSDTNSRKQEDRKKDTNTSNLSSLDSRFNQTLRNVQGLLKGRSFPGKVLITRSQDPLSDSSLHSPDIHRRFSDKDVGTSDRMDDSVEDEIQGKKKPNSNPILTKSASSISSSDNSSSESQKSTIGARATDSARLLKFTKVLSGTTIILDKLRELAWSGVPSYLRPTVWRLLLGYAPPNSDRRDGVLRRKRLEYLDCVAQYCEISDTERTDEEINMLRQIAVDCPRTVPDVPFFQQAAVQKSLERILYTWAIRHPASGYVQGINDLATPFLVVFLSEYLEGGVDNWSTLDLAPEKITNVEADCYWCLSKLLDGMQDHYTFAQPGIQRLVFKLKELVRRIDEPVSRHMEEQGLEFLQFAFRWFNCLLIREWSEQLQKLDFQEMVMFLQHLPTQNWTHLELEMVLSRAYMWHTMFNSSPSHLAS